MFRPDKAGVKAGDRISSGSYVEEMIDENNMLKIKNNCIGTGQYAYRLDNLKNVIVPFGCKNVGDLAFLEVEGLESISYPDTLETFGRSVHESNISLKNINLCDNMFTSSLKEIGDKAFNGCFSLKNIDIPVSVKKLGKNVFEGCSNLEHIRCSERIAEQIVKSLSTSDNHNPRMSIEAFDSNGLKVSEYFINRIKAFKVVIARDEANNISNVNVLSRGLCNQEWQLEENETTRQAICKKRESLTRGK